MSSVVLATLRPCSRSSLTRLSLLRVSSSSSAAAVLHSQYRSSQIQPSGVFTPSRSSSSSSSRPPLSLSDPSSSGAVPNVPGLFYFPAFFSETEHQGLLDSGVRLQQRLEEASEGREAASGANAAPPSHTVSIPQPAYVRSAKHNLPSEERYQALKIKDKIDEAGVGPANETGNVLGCEYFRRYGEDGHVLVYFRGNSNIPSFVRRRMIQRMEERVPVVKEVAQKKADTGTATPLTWKMTLNVYHLMDAGDATSAGARKSRLSGFPFHQDLPANGAVTMIASLGRGAMLQIVHKDHVPEQDVEEAEAARSPHVRSVWMEPASLLVLSGEARWDWRHRVLPTTDEATSGEKNGAATPLVAVPGAGSVGRVSIVLGCQ